jgi:tetratricopeptide (TPR) repeat protein
MNAKQFIKLFAIIGFFCPLALFGQATKKDAVDAYNAGAQIIKQDPKAALESLYLSLKLSTELGEDGEETKILAESLIPRTHLELAMKFYGEKKMYETLEQLEKAQELAEKYNDNSTKQRVERTIPQLYNQMGNTQYRSNNFEKAIEYYNKAIKAKTDYPDPYLGISLSYEKLNDFDKMLESLKRTLEVANSVNDRNKAEDATTKAKAFLLRKGDEAQKANKNAEAVKWFTRSLDFDPNDGSVYYALSINFNALKDWDNAIANGNLALEKGNGSIDSNGVYFQIGTAYQEKGMSNEACKAFSNAQGSFKAAAEYQMKEKLKCN